MKLYVILGYLGSGKTTFLYSFYRQFKNMRNAVIVNDFGDEDVDGKILAEYMPKTVYGGSMFCSCKSDKFVEVAIEISKTPYDNLIVEASGFSNPFIMNDLITLINQKAENKLELGGVVTIVDVTNFEKILTTLKMTKMQVAFADLIVINKCDLASESDVSRVENILKQINCNARIEKSINGIPQSYEIALVEKTLPQNVFDIKLQKTLIELDKSVTKEQLDDLCGKLSEFSHRIKGTVVIDKQSYIYQFANGKGSLSKTDVVSDNKIVLLSAYGNFIKNVTREIESVNFAKITSGI